MDNEKARAALYCFAEGRVRRRTNLDGIAITNGPAVSPDGRLLYFVDTLRGTIKCAEIRGMGKLGDRRPFVKIEPTAGHPDGPTIDSEGCVDPLYAGWEARRYSPQGQLLEKAQLPLSKRTKIALGGDDLRTAYATTARQLLSQQEISKQPQSRMFLN